MWRRVFACVAFIIVSSLVGAGCPRESAPSTNQGPSAGSDQGSPGESEQGSPGGSDQGSPGGSDQGSPGGSDQGSPGVSDHVSPDLVPQNVLLDVSTVAAGGRVQLSFSIVNQSKATAASWTTRIRLSGSLTSVSTSDPLLKELVEAALDAGAKRDHAVPLVIPAETAAGQKYLWVIADADNTAGQTSTDQANDKANVPLQVRAVQPDTVATPTFTPNGGTFTNPVDVTISTPTSGAAIRYTTDQSLPTSSTGLAYSGLIHLTTTTTLKAIACKAGMIDSAVSERVFTVNAAPPGMVLIPAGEFLMGNSFEPSEGSSGELPRHAVYIDAFYMDRCLVTNQQYADALNWANTQGNLITVICGVVYKYNSGYPIGDPAYCDTTNHCAGAYLPNRQITWNGSTFSVTAGKENYPVLHVTWFGSAAYANWRSGMEGRPLGYDLSTWNCNWNGGYRLPTEAEWEKAARGGVEGHRFPWSDSDTIQHARANYRSDSSYAYDTSPTRGWHAAFNTGENSYTYMYNYTSPVGYFAPNAYGLYDMAGNACQWCNDWWDRSYYGSNPYIKPYRNPHGPDTGSYRIKRGGSWDGYAEHSRVAFRYGNSPYELDAGSGLRLAMASP